MQFADAVSGVTAVRWRGNSLLDGVVFLIMPW